MKYANNGSLTDYMTKSFKDLKWENKISILYNIILGLNTIHKKQLIHHDLHSGNILHSNEFFQGAMIADLGLSAPADQSSTSIITLLLSTNSIPDPAVPADIWYHIKQFKAAL